MTDQGREAETAAGLETGRRPMVRLQDRWYLHLVAQFLRDPALFQIRLPGAPLDATDAALWSALDRTPPRSLTFDTAQRGGDGLFASYAAVVDQTAYPDEGLEPILGPERFAQWLAYIGAQSPAPTPAEEARLFGDWAARYAPHARPAGMAYLYARSLHAAARASLIPVIEAGEAPPFVGSYADLSAQLSHAPGRDAAFDSVDAPDDVTGTWAQGTEPDLPGLLARSAPARIDRRFALNRVTATFRAERFTVWAATPGTWYSSWLLGTAFAARTSPPWRPDADPSWDTLFGSDGALTFATASLTVADGISLVVRSDARYGRSDRALIASRVADGAWPLYARGPDVANTVVFPDEGGMEIATTIPAGRPVVIGADVLPIARYLGAATG